MKPFPDDHSLRSRRSAVHAAAAALALACALSAQTPIGSTETFGSQRRIIVRAAAYLYAVTVDPSGAVQLWRRDVAGGDWASFVANVNSSASGMHFFRPANEVSLASTDDGYLHVTWGRFYLGLREQYYRVVKTDGSMGNELKLNVAFGHAETDSIDIVVGTAKKTVMFYGFPIVVTVPRVFVCAQTGSPWQNRLLLIDRPAAGWQAPLEAHLTDCGLISPIGTSQRVRLAVDPYQRVHAVYYNNTTPGVVHRVFTPPPKVVSEYQSPPMSWAEHPILSIGSGHLDSSIDVSAATDGKVHVLYNHWTSSTEAELTHRVLDNGTWSQEKIVAVQPDGANFDHRFAIMASTTNGRVFAVRSDAQGALWLDSLTPGGGTFEPLYELWPDGSPVSTFPALQGTLFPVSNRMGCDLHALLRIIDPPVRAYHQSIEACSFTTGDPGCSYEGRIFFVDQPGLLTIGLDGATVGSFCCLFVSTLQVNYPFALCGCPLRVEPHFLFPFFAVGPDVRLTFAEPPVSNVTLYAQWAELHPNGNCGPGNGLSNLGSVHFP